MTKERGNRWSGAAGRALDFLFLANPLRTSMGALLGIAANGLLQLLEPTLRYYFAYTSSPMTVAGLIALGVFLFNIPGVFKRRPRFDPAIEKAFQAIERAKLEGLSSWEINNMYRQLCQHALERILADAELTSSDSSGAVGIPSTVQTPGSGSPNPSLPAGGAATAAED